MSETDKWLTVDDLAEYLEMGRTKLYPLAQQGNVPGAKIGNQWRFDREGIDQWIKTTVAKIDLLRTDIDTLVAEIEGGA